MVAVSLSFPDFDPNAEDDDKKVLYRLNKIAVRELFGDEENQGDDEDINSVVEITPGRGFRLS
jgi:hypothetical protein